MKKQSNNLRFTGKKSGFTLMELMMAMGILAVGLAVVATAFPSAMLENKYSIADTSATMVSENAVAICRVKLSHNDIKGLGATLVDRTTRISSAAHTGDLTWPINTPASSYGWLLAVRQVSGGDSNDYQLAIVPYRKFLPGDPPPAFSFVTTDGSKITGGTISVGSPVICRADGSFAYVFDSSGNLTGTITAGAAMAVGASGQESPAIGCCVVRTAVAP